jgi:hypothetical protein
VALDHQHWWYYIAGCLGAGLIALVLSFLNPGITRFSEAKVALLLGAVFGPWTLAAVPVGFILRFVTGITLVFCQKGRLEARTVFAPYSTDRDVRKPVEVVSTHDAKVDAEVMTWQ